MIPVLAQTLRRPEPILGLAARVTWLSPASAAPGSRSTTQAEGGLGTQYSGILGCRGIYHKGWMASTFGPRVPWVRGLPAGIHDWIAYRDTWELYHLGEDWSQASDLAAEMPGKFAELKELFLIEATKAGAFPIGGGLWIPMLHPELRPAPNECLDIGVALGSPVSPDYYDKAPFKFTGTIERVHVACVIPK